MDLFHDEMVSYKINCIVIHVIDIILALIQFTKDYYAYFAYYKC